MAGKKNKVYSRAVSCDDFFTETIPRLRQRTVVILMIFFVNICFSNIIVLLICLMIIILNEQGWPHWFGWTFVFYHLLGVLCLRLLASHFHSV